MTGDDVKHNKPDPEPLHQIAQRTQCREDEIIMVGDALADVRCARAAGATGILVLWGHHDTRPGHSEKAREEAHAICPTVQALDEWLTAHGAYDGDGTTRQQP